MEVNIEDLIQENVLDVGEEIQQHPNLEKKVRGKYSKSYGEHDLGKAVDDVKSKRMTGYAAAKCHKVPYSTIMNRVYGNASNIHGRVPVFSSEIEREIAQWIIQCAELGDPRTKDELLNAAAELAKLSLEDKNHFKNEHPSSSWLKGFLERNKGISFRTPASVTRAAANVSSEEIVNFIRNLHNYLQTNNLLHLLNEPTAWGNSDETGVDYNPVPRKVLAEKGALNVYRVETAKPKERVSVMYTFIASGVMLTPQLILKDSTSCIADVAFACGGKFFTIEFFFPHSKNLHFQKSTHNSLFAKLLKVIRPKTLSTNSSLKTWSSSSMNMELSTQPITRSCTFSMVTSATTHSNFSSGANKTISSSSCSSQTPLIYYKCAMLVCSEHSRVFMQKKFSSGRLKRRTAKSTW
jgi:Tc5 transposase DNA-binding domain